MPTSTMETLEKVPTGPYPSSRCPKISQCTTFTYDLDAFPTAASVLGLGKSATLVSCSPLVLPDLIPAGFQSQML